LNIALTQDGDDERLQIFDPHVGDIDPGAAVHDPLEPDAPRALDSVLRASRDGSRWALWRAQQEAGQAPEVPDMVRAEAAALVTDFHNATEGLEQGRGAFGAERFRSVWQQRPTHVVNTVMHAELWALAEHPVSGLLVAALADGTQDAVYDRRLVVRAMQGEAALAQFHAALKLYAERPLLIVANLSADTSTLVAHWGRLTLPPELDLQNDPAIHYHLRDLFTGERYVRSGEVLVQEGLVVGLPPGRIHVLQVEDVRVEDVVLEQSLVGQDDLAPLLDACSRRVGVVGDVHGELEALREILRALRFVDASGAWCARDGSLVLTGDLGHGPGLAETFDFLRALAAQAHARGGRVVWTLGNHDLFSDRDGGQGGDDSVGYCLWPQVREAVLRPERNPGLLVCAVHCEHGKLFVHGGVLPHVVDLAHAECGSRDAQTVAEYINALFRQALAESERLAVDDIDHPIFRVGTSHAAIRRMPGEAGYEPAGVFTPDLRELDHYRFHTRLLPQVVGHTASRRGRIRYAPGSWFSRDYIAVDVGRQHGRGNAGLLLTDFGWLAVTPGGAARLVEVTPLFARVVREAVPDAASRTVRDVRISEILGGYFRVDRQAFPVDEALRADLTPAQLLALEQFVGIVREEARCLVVTDLTESLSAFFGAEHAEDSLDRLCRYLQAGGAIAFSSELGFEWFYMRLLRPLIEALGNELTPLRRVPLILSGAEHIFVFRDGGYMLHSTVRGRRVDDALALLMRLLEAGQVEGVPVMHRRHTLYVADSTPPRAIHPGLAHGVGSIVDVGDRTLDAETPIARLHRTHLRLADVLAALAAALPATARRESGEGTSTGPPMLWTFAQPHFSVTRRVRVQVGGSGFVHAGLAHTTGAWKPRYNIPLLRTEARRYEALLPEEVNAFTFFWTEPPWSDGLPGHWEHDRQGPRVFRTDDGATG
jgi:hypothetical protein